MKVQQLKTGTLIVTIPTQLARALNIQKGDDLNFEFNKDRELVLKKWKKWFGWYFEKSQCIYDKYIGLYKGFFHFKLSSLNLHIPAHKFLHLSQF